MACSKVERGQNQNWLPQPCLLGGPKVGGNATSPLHSRGPPTKGTESKRAQKRADMLHHPCILRGPQQRGQNQNWLPKPCLLGGPQVGGNATSPCFLGDPQQRGQNQSTKKTKQQKQKISHGVLNPAYSPADCPRGGLNPGPFNCSGTALPTRVWAISDTPLHRVVFIFCPIWCSSIIGFSSKKYFEYRHMG